MDIDEVPKWFDNLFAFQIALWIAILVVVVGVVAKLWRPAKRFIEGIDTLFGTGENDALADRLARIEDKQSTHTVKIDTIYREVLPNHGSSLRDQVDCVSRRVDEIASFQERDYHRMQAHLEEAEISKAVIERIVDRVGISAEGGEHDRPEGRKDDSSSG